MKKRYCDLPKYYYKQPMQWTWIDELRMEYVRDNKYFIGSSQKPQSIYYKVIYKMRDTTDVYMRVKK